MYDRVQMKGSQEKYICDVLRECRFYNVKKVLPVSPEIKALRSQSILYGTSIAVVTLKTC